MRQAKPPAEPRPEARSSEQRPSTTGASLGPKVQTSAPTPENQGVLHLAGQPARGRDMTPKALDIGPMPSKDEMAKIAKEQGQSPRFVEQQIHIMRSAERQKRGLTPPRVVSDKEEAQPDVAKQPDEPQVEKPVVPPPAQVKRKPDVPELDFAKVRPQEDPKEAPKEPAPLSDSAVSSDADQGTSANHRVSPRRGRASQADSSHGRSRTGNTWCSVRIFHPSV